MLTGMVAVGKKQQSLLVWSLKPCTCSPQKPEFSLEVKNLHVKTPWRKFPHSHPCPSSHLPRPALPFCWADAECQPEESQLWRKNGFLSPFSSPYTNCSSKKTQVWKPAQCRCLGELQVPNVTWRCSLSMCVCVNMGSI